VLSDGLLLPTEKCVIISMLVQRVESVSDQDLQNKLIYLAQT
jgi:hypothetical protein